MKGINVMDEVSSVRSERWWKYDSDVCMGEK